MYITIDVKNIGTLANGTHHGNSPNTIPIIALAINVNKSNINPIVLIVFIV